MKQVLDRLGIKELNFGASTGRWLDNCSGPVLESYSPIDGKLIASVKQCEVAEYQQVMATAESAYKEWRKVPAPQRGEIVRQIGDALRAKKQELGTLVPGMPATFLAVDAPPGELPDALERLEGVYLRGRRLVVSED